MTQFSQEMFDSVGLRTTIITLFVLNYGANGVIQGECVFTTQTESSTTSSANNPFIYNIVFMCSVQSDPVGMPVNNWKYLRRKELPERGNEQKPILLLGLGWPSKKEHCCSNNHLFLFQSTSSFDLNRATSWFKLTVGEQALALMWPQGSISQSG